MTFNSKEKELHNIMMNIRYDSSPESLMFLEAMLNYKEPIEEELLARKERRLKEIAKEEKLQKQIFIIRIILFIIVFVGWLYLLYWLGERDKIQQQEVNKTVKNLQDYKKSLGL